MNPSLPILGLAQVPTIDVSQLHHDSPSRPLVIQKIHHACRKTGIFQVVNHGISQMVIDNALDSLSKFFNLPIDEKTMLSSDDITKPVRFGTTQSNGIDSRDFIKLYANPIEDWIDLWPNNPRDFRENVGKYALEVRRLGIDIMGAVTESLGLNPTYLRSSLEQGVHIQVANSYPPQCSPSSNNILGLPPHTDHSLITILLENASGLEIMDDGTHENAWQIAPATKGTLKVLVGNHLEVLSNGVYESVFHRAIPSPRMTRVSIANFFSLTMEEMVEPAMEMVDEEHPKRYRATNLHEFFMHLSSKEEKLSYIEGLESYIEGLKI